MAAQRRMENVRNQQPRSELVADEAHVAALTEKSSRQRGQSRPPMYLWRFVTTPHLHLTMFNGGEWSRRRYKDGGQALVQEGIQLMEQSRVGIERRQENDVRCEAEKNLFFENRVAQEWLTTESAAQYLGVSENALRIMIHRGQIRVHKLGRRLRFRADDLRALFTLRGV